MSGARSNRGRPIGPNLKSVLRIKRIQTRVGEAKVSLWMGENDARHEEARGPTRQSSATLPHAVCFQIFSQRVAEGELVSNGAGVASGAVCWV